MALKTLRIFFGRKYRVKRATKYYLMVCVFEVVSVFGIYYGYRLVNIFKIFTGKRMINDDCKKGVFGIEYVLVYYRLTGWK